MNAEELLLVNNLNISIVVAMGKNREIGNNNKLLWHLPNDLQHFKKLTMGKPVVMGRKTFESIGKPLPGRDNLVLTSTNPDSITEHSKNFKNKVKIFSDFNNLLKFLVLNYDKTEIMIIGGGRVYQNFLPYAKKIYLTLVDAVFTADVFFPDLDSSLWQECAESRVNFQQDENHAYGYSFLEYEKLV